MYLYGLFPEGCRYDRENALLEASMPKELYVLYASFFSGVYLSAATRCGGGSVLAAG